MTIICLNKRYYSIPTQWNELSQRQLLAAMNVLISHESVDKTVLQLLRILTGISWFRFLMAPMKEKEQFLYLTFFMVESNELTRQIITRYRRCGGPDDDFNNITGNEYVFSEHYYFQYLQEKQDIYLDQLVAVLYRPLKRRYNFRINPDGDTRRPFNENECNYRAGHSVRKWPYGVKLAILYWYQACREKMLLDNPDVFTGDSSEPARFGLISLMRTIAEGGIHGTFNEVQNMHVKMWMMELNERVDEVKKQEKAMKDG